MMSLPAFFIKSREDDKKMGCDIHVHTEKLITKSDGTSIWVNTDNFQYNYEEKVIYNIDDADDFIFRSIYHGRDYKLFGILAGVRSFSQYQIDEKRGFPSDVSDETKKQFIKGSDHTPSYYTLRELLDYEKK